MRAISAFASAARGSPRCGCAARTASSRRSGSTTAASIGADLFVDCTGPAATLRAALDQGFEPWDRWLPCDRLLLAETPPPAEPTALDHVVALPAGWRWQAASAVRTSHGLVYASAALGDDDARALLRDAAGAEAEGAPVTIRAGRRPEPWLRNCVAIGDAAVAMEPLEWGNLHLAHSAIDRIIAMMPDRELRRGRALGL